MERWEKPPGADSLIQHYLDPARAQLDVILSVDEAAEISRDLARMGDWAEYRASTLKMDPVHEEARLRRHMKDVEQLFGFPLEGEVNLFGSFQYMDGYARFDRGTHRVFLGIDESYDDGAYIDILTTHELSHVARESRPTVWEGWGLNPKMTQAEFTDSQPVIEHLMGEGMSCFASEVLVPGQEPWLYAYQEQEGLAKILKNAAVVDQVVKRELVKASGDYGNLYQTRHYGPGMPGFTHYVWAWKWVAAVARELADDDCSWLVNQCSKDFLDHALRYELKTKSQSPK